ncbi:MAG: VWA domain-containing protein [Dehalococcoidia bacterium]
MIGFRYSRWDGSQQVFPLDEGAIMGELSDQLLSQGDVNSALRNLMRRGLPGQFGDRSMGIQDLLQRLQNRRQQQLQQYNLGTALDDIKKKLESVLGHEEAGIQRQLDRAASLQSQAEGATDSDLDPETVQKLLQDLQRRAARSRDFLATVPRDNPAQAIKQLRDYEFMDAQAKQEFDELMQMLQQQVADSFFKDISQSLRDMSPEQMQALRQMVQDLNEMLEQRMNDQEPDFQRFMDRYGHLFGPNPPQSLDELIEQMQRQMGQIQSLLDSLSPEQSKQLQDLVQSVFGDSDLQYELSRLAGNVEYLDPMGSMRREYAFAGEDEVDLSEALKLMDKFHKLDDLERQLRRLQQGGSGEEIDPELVRDLLGEEARRALEQLTRLAEFLEKEGYLKKVGGRFELTPKGMRKIGQRALQEIFAYIKKDRTGGHRIEPAGQGVENADDTKPYEFGDPFIPHLQKTIMNAVMRESTGVPVHIRAEDFEVYRTEHQAQASTVLMLDLSLSMAMRGNFVAAKKVALALDNLIRTKFPRDKMFIVGFSTYAREIKADRLPYLNWDEFDPYTNIQHGLAVSQKLLSRVKGGTKQIIMISDGEPTAHMEGGQLFLQYPPSPRTLRATLSEVKRCTQQSIVINTFMLDRNSYLIDFIDQLTRINRGRVFYTSPERLGQYILVDYLNNRRRKLVV